MDDFADLTKDIQEAAAQAAVPSVDEQVRRQILAGSEIPTHETAMLFPSMRASDEVGFTQLVEDIIRTGVVNESIKINKAGLLLDGRNRIDAIREAKKQGKTIKFKVEVVTHTSESDWIMSTNLHRRHLTASQRAVLGQAFVRRVAPEKGVAAATAEAAAKLNVSSNVIHKARSVAEGKPEALKDIVDGKTTVNMEYQKMQAAKRKEAGLPPTVAQVNAGLADISEAPTAGSRSKKKKAAPATRTEEKQKVAVAAPPAPPSPSSGVAEELTEDELTTLKALLSKASVTQLAGLAGFLKGLLIAAKQIEGRPK